MASGVIVDGRYELMARLGAGGMAEVWSARDRELGREVALKLLYRHLAADQDFVERFRREASAAAGLQHPNVVQVYDRGESQGTYYIAMEYLRGPSLKDLVRRGPVEPRYAVELVGEVLKAARFAHRRGIIHRDFKPHNVMLDDEGRVKVTDFGIARAGASDMTQTGSILGTAQYLSPEQAQGHSVTARSDLYSIGVILFELLTGRVPFDGESAVSIALRHVSEPPPRPSDLVPSVGPHLDAVVLRALEKDPDDRFQDADEFLAALAGAPAAVPAARTVAAGAAPAATTVGRDEPAYAPGDEREEERAARTGPWWLAGLLLLVVAGLGAYLWLQEDQVTVPNVVNREEAVATRMLERAGFDVEVNQVSSSRVGEGRVVSQAPEPGEDVSEGSVVVISISTGPAQREVPDVRGSPLGEARSELRDAGFRTTVAERRYSDDVEEGSVISTTPAPGETVDMGTQVALVVSRGVAPVTVPDVTGMDEEEATTALEQLDLRPVVETRETDEEDPGEVLEQSPAAGSELAPGSGVTIVVAEAPPDVEVPDVVGMEFGDARSELRDAGFRVRRERVSAATPDQDGQVLAQDPEGGSELAPGSEVRLDVGRFEPEDPEAGGPDPDADEGQQP